MTIKKNRFIFNCIYILIFIIFLLLIFLKFSWEIAAILSVCLLVLSLFCLKGAFEINIISYSSLFLVCLWIFYCGQIMNYAFDLEGTNYLYFINYGSENSCRHAFIFYFIAQFLLTEFIGKSYGKRRNKKTDSSKKIPNNFSHLLFAIGIIPRLYCDFTYLNYGLANGYDGRAVYLPQFVNTLAYFADIAILIELVRAGRRKSSTILLLVILIYKIIMMMSGSRAEAFCFIIVAVYIYFFINKKDKVIKLFMYILIGYFTLAFIMTIGDLRADAFQSFSVLGETFWSNVTGGFLSDMFGEFGSAFTTLVKTINDTPSQVDYGYGLSYLSGILSVVPTLVSKIPFLSNMTAYISQYSNVSSFGGAFLGELYYNFGWFGLLAVPIVGKIVGWINALLESLKMNKNINNNTILSLVLAVSMLLFIRGYFSDMVQKIVWLLVFAYFMTNYVYKKGGKKFR